VPRALVGSRALDLDGPPGGAASTALALLLHICTAGEGRISSITPITLVVVPGIVDILRTGLGRGTARS
jgi:hypothetical protein